MNESAGGREDFVELVNRYAVERQAAGEWPTEQRLLRALSCETPDIVPVCVPAFDLYRWADDSYSELLPVIAAHTDPIYEVYMGYDTIAGLADVATVTEHLSNGDVLHRVLTPKGDLTEIIPPSVDGSTHLSRVKWWFEDPDDAIRFLAVPWEPSHRDTRDVMAMSDQLRGSALTIVLIDAPLQSVANLIGTGRMCLWSATETRLLKHLLDALFERIMDELHYLLSQGLGPVFRVSGSEFAIPPLMSLNNYEELAFPYERAMAEAIHGVGQKMILHCHGKVSSLLERFVEIGADGTDPCEPAPLGDVDLADAKRRVAGKLSLWGNIEYNLLSQAEEEGIERLVRQVIEDGGPDGFVLVPSCRLHENPLPARTQRNLMRLIQVAQEYRHR